MYSADIRSLCDELLHKDPNKRPTIATVLQRPILAKLIDKYLTAQQRADEFAHTVLHGVNQRVCLFDFIFWETLQKFISNGFVICRKWSS
jgi:hypothetical protein